MATILSTGARNAACNAVVDLVDVGAGANGTLEILDGAVVAVTFQLNAVAFGAAAVGVATAAGLPISAVAGADVPAADNYIIKDKDGATVWTGNVGLVGSGADIELDNTIIANGQTVTINTFTHTQPA